MECRKLKKILHLLHSLTRFCNNVTKGCQPWCRYLKEELCTHTNYTPWSHQHQQTIKSWLNGSWELSFFHWRICNHIIDVVSRDLHIWSNSHGLVISSGNMSGSLWPYSEHIETQHKTEKKTQNTTVTFKVSGTLLARVTLLHLYTLRKQQGCVRYNKSSSKTNALSKQLPTQDNTAFFPSQILCLWYWLWTNNKQKAEEEMVLVYSIVHSNLSLGSIITANQAASNLHLESLFPFSAEEGSITLPPTISVWSLKVSSPTNQTSSYLLQI